MFEQLLGNLTINMISEMNSSPFNKNTGADLFDIGGEISAENGWEQVTGELTIRFTL